MRMNLPRRSPLVMGPWHVVRDSRGLPQAVLKGSRAWVDIEVELDNHVKHMYVLLKMWMTSCTATGYQILRTHFQYFLSEYVGRRAVSSVTSSLVTQHQVNETQSRLSPTSRKRGPTRHDRKLTCDEQEQVRA